MDTLQRTRDHVLVAVKHCEAKGYCDGRGINNFVPHDCVAAFTMADLLIHEGFDHFVAVAPEGHIDGSFLERLGATVCSVLRMHATIEEVRLRSVEGLTSPPWQQPSARERSAARPRLGFARSCSVTRAT